MKAVVYENYGSPDQFQIKDLPVPVPKENEVLLKIHAAAVNAYDWRHLRADPFLIRLMGAGLFRPKHPVLGADMAGTVAAVGKDVKDFAPGDGVFGEISYGAFAEYACTTENRLARKPESLSFSEAAALPMAGLTALQALRDTGKIRQGEDVLIYGASGGVGTFAVQLAKVFGARVTAVCSTAKVEMMRKLGADQVVDYQKDDPTQPGGRFDLILAANGYQPLAVYRRLLKPTGRYVATGGSMRQIFGAMLLGPWFSRKGGQQFGSMTAQILRQDLETLGALAAAGKIKPLIDRSFPLAQTADAVRHLETGHARGKVVITVSLV